MKSLVEDKEARINEVMKMMGMPADARWMWNPVEPMVPEKITDLLVVWRTCGKWNLDIQRFSDDPFHMDRLHNTSPFHGVTRYLTRAFNGLCSSSMTIKDGDKAMFLESTVLINVFPKRCADLTIFRPGGNLFGKAIPVSDPAVLESP